MSPQYPGNDRIILFIALIIVVCTTCSKEEPLFVCNDPIGCVDIDPGDPVKIGVLQALSGKIAPLGLEQIRGIELAIDNKYGTLHGHKIMLHTEDTGCTGEGGANAVLKIIADPQTVAIFGTTCSGAARTVSKAMSKAGFTMISGNNSAPFLTSIGGKQAPDWYPGYFRTSGNEENAGKAAALYAYKHLGIRNAATINDGDIYTKGLTNGFINAFKDLGGAIVLDTSINKGDKQMQPVLTAVKNSNAKLLFFPLFQPEGNHILLQARKNQEFKDIILMSDGALIETSFINAVMDSGKGMYFVGPSRPTSPEIAALAVKYKKKFKTQPSASYYLSAFDAANLLFKAIESTAVKDANGTLHIGRRALRDTLYATKNVKGITGSLSCDTFGDCATPVFNILRLDDPGAGLEGLQSNVLYSYTPESPPNSKGRNIP